MPDYTILLIDYEPRSVELVRNTLQGAGFRVETAADGLQGIEAFRAVRPDLTLVEAMLPKKHGFEVCQHLKTTSHGAVTPVAIITAIYKGRKYRHQALHHYKADEYIEKPIAPDFLLTTVNKLLAAFPAARPAATATPEAAAPAVAKPMAAGAPEANAPPRAARAPQAAATPKAAIPPKAAAPPKTPPKAEAAPATPKAAAARTASAPAPAAPAAKSQTREEALKSHEAEINERLDSLFS